MSGGCLTDILEQFENGVHMNEGHIALVCGQVLAGLNYIHSCHRIHRDIKSDNILIGLYGDVKIADFGYAAQLTTKQAKRQTVVGVRFLFFIFFLIYLNIIFYYYYFLLFLFTSLII